MNSELKRHRGKPPRKILISSVEEFPPGSRREVVIGRAVVAVFNIAGTYYGIHGICPHQFAPLSQGKLQGTVICNAATGWEVEWVHDGEVIVCPGHAMEFHVKTGEAFGYGFRLRTYEVVVEDNQVKLVL